jgi:rhodanese-related sulfurtransferase
MASWSKPPPRCARILKVPTVIERGGGSIYGFSPITPQEVNERINRGERVLLWTPAPRDEVPSPEVRLPAAVRAPADEADQHMRDINRDRLAVLYDEEPDQSYSKQVAELFDKHGFKEARPLAGGMKAWRDEGFPVERH